MRKRTTYKLWYTEATSNKWTEIPEYNKMSIMCEIEYLNTEFDIDGIISVKDIFSGFGFVVKGHNPELLSTCFVKSDKLKKLPIKAKPLENGVDYEITISLSKAWRNES